MSTQNQQTNEPDAALVRQISDEIWRADPRLKFEIGFDEVENRVRDFLLKLRPSDGWGTRG